MGFEVLTDVEPDLIRFTVSGKYSLDDLYSLIEQIKNDADKALRKMTLVDARAIVGEISDADQFFAGRKIAETFGSRLKTAVLRGGNKDTKLGEAVAVSRGAKFLVTDSEETALEWLLTD